jgi:hypothetical protein
VLVSSFRFAKKHTSILKLIPKDDVEVQLNPDHENKKQCDSESSISSGDPTIAESDSDDDFNAPVWIPLKEKIDHNIQKIEEISK